MSADKYAELRRLAEAATPGPWVWNEYGQRLSCGKKSIIDINNSCMGIDCREDGWGAAIGCDISDKQAEANAALIAAANPSTILSLLNELEACRATIESTGVKTK